MIYIISNESIKFLPTSEKLHMLLAQKLMQLLLLHRLMLLLLQNLMSSSLSLLHRHFCRLSLSALFICQLRV